MRTEEEIKKELFIQHSYLETTDPALVSHRSGVIDALKWVLKDIQEIGESEPKSMEEILLNLESSIKAPNPYFQWLKERPNAR